MKKIMLALLFLLGGNALAQDKETRAQAYYMAAESFYNNSEFEKALAKLTETENVLGTSNAKIEYLKVKSLVVMKKFADAKQELNKYFDFASNSKGTEKYNEMMMLYGRLDDMVKEQEMLEKTIKEKESNIPNLVYKVDSVMRIYYQAIDSISLQNTRLILHFKKSFIKWVTKRTQPKSINLLHVEKAYRDEGYGYFGFKITGEERPAIFQGMGIDKKEENNLLPIFNELVAAVKDLYKYKELPQDELPVVERLTN